MPIASTQCIPVHDYTDTPLGTPGPSARQTIAGEQYQVKELTTDKNVQNMTSAQQELLMNWLRAILAVFSARSAAKEQDPIAPPPAVREFESESWRSKNIKLKSIKSESHNPVCAPAAGELAVHAMGSGHYCVNSKPESVRFADLRSTDIKSFKREGSDLVLDYSSKAYFYPQRMTLFDNFGAGDGVKQLVFRDGVTLNMEQIKALIAKA